MMTRPGRFLFRFRQRHYYLMILWVLAQPAMAGSAAQNLAYQDRFGQAHSLAQRGDLAGAAAIYEELIKQAPQQPAAFNNLAAIRARQGLLEEAQALLEQALHNHPDYAAVYENLSAVYVEMARDSYGKALRLDAPAKAVTLRELKTATLSEAPAAQLATREDTPAALPAAAVTPPAPPAGAVPQTALPPTASQPAAETDRQAAAVPDAVAAPAAGPDKEAIVTTLQGWAAAWSEKAVDLYLVFYTNDYHPEGMSRRRWEAQRRERLQAPQWIQVELNDIDVQEIKADQARVRLIQDYRADNYQDRTLKEFRLRLTADGWRISSEESISRLD